MNRFAETPEEEREWFEKRQEQAKRIEEAKESDDLALMLDACSIRDISMKPRPPKWAWRDREANYRRGYWHGFDEAIQNLCYLYRHGGYSRPAEIANILAAFCGNIIYRWRTAIGAEEPINHHSVPRLKQPTWSELRSRVINRDGWRCVACGSNQRLEVDHIEPVRDGGESAESNLRTLCFGCHRSRSRS